MLYEPTTLANVARIIGETLQKDYGIDPAAVFITDDQQFGLKAGVRAEPSDFYVLGHAWLASATLKGALERLCRYAHVLSTAITQAEVVDEDDMVVFVESFPDPSIVINRTADEAGMVTDLPSRQGSQLSRRIPAVPGHLWQRAREVLFFEADLRGAPARLYP
jgi:hypothetical protein